VKSITPSEAYKNLQNDEAFIIDVREQNEFDQCRIAGTVLVPLSQLVESISSIEIPSDKKLIFHCLRGGRSADAILYLEENILKDRDVYNMEGGILEWIEAGHPVISNAE
jgi:rhodanese-related sulfurtransferase